MKAALMKAGMRVAVDETRVRGWFARNAAEAVVLEPTSTYRESWSQRDNAFVFTRVVDAATGTFEPQPGSTLVVFMAPGGAWRPRVVRSYHVIGRWDAHVQERDRREEERRAAEERRRIAAAVALAGQTRIEAALAAMASHFTTNIVSGMTRGMGAEGRLGWVNVRLTTEQALLIGRALTTREARNALRQGPAWAVLVEAQRQRIEEGDLHIEDLDQSFWNALGTATQVPA